jgi:hypothetical protein
VFTLLGCQSTLNTAGQDHALVVKKWQQLAQYIDDSTTNNPFTIVGKLTVDTESDKQKFILSNIHLSQQETMFELNLIRPTFENKYICLPICLQLTEYFSTSKENSTMLNIYFEQHEFELFKFYGDVVLQNDSINTLYEFSPVAATRYFNWLILKGQKFSDLASISQFLTSALTQDSLIAFLNDPDKFYASLLAQSKDTINTLNVWSTDDEQGPMENWTSMPTADETLYIKNGLSQDLRLQNWLKIKDKPLAIGDQVCNYSQNEFGTVNGIMGNQVQVRLVGKLIKFEDGMPVSTLSGDIYNLKSHQLFAPINRVESYKADVIAPCDLN